jgi:aminoglycoside phosphotransferase (APT) family kinase protein
VRSDTVTRRAGVDPSDADLEVLVAAVLRERRDSPARIRREPWSFARSYRAEVVLVEAASGRTEKLFFEDFAAPRFETDDEARRRDRQLHVYRELLPGMQLGTAAYRGSLCGGTREQFWLLLEFVDEVEVRLRPLEGWIAAAAWVGRLHRTRRWSVELARSPLLMRHDEAWLRSPADAPMRDASCFGWETASRLRRVPDGYDAVVHAMAAEPRCLVHGGYRAANVLLAADGNGRRVCPLDWELAAVGSPVHDLATLVDGFEPPKLDALLGAYVREALDTGSAVAGPDELRHLVDCFRLHRIVADLGRAQRSGYRPARVDRLVARAEALSKRLHGAPSRPSGQGSDAADLRRHLRDLLPGRAVRLLSHDPISPHVHRLRADVDGTEQSLILKRSSPEAARRTSLTAQRWLPAAGLAELGPPLVAVAVEATGERAWQLHDELPGHPVAVDRPVRREVEAAIEGIARVHTAFAEHPLLHECRLWGGDRGIAFFSGNVRDAARALRALQTVDGAARDTLLERFDRLAAQETERARALAALGGPETLMHGDLWNTNIIVAYDGPAIRVRLIDWDEAAVGSFTFDLATLLLRFPRAERPWVFDAYSDAVDRLAGWRLPPRPELDALFATAAYGRLASLLVWTVATARHDDSGWLPAFLGDVLEWVDAVEPVVGR